MRQCPCGAERRATRGPKLHVPCEETERHERGRVGGHRDGGRRGLEAGTTLEGEREGIGAARDKRQEREEKEACGS
jgi:hypothetical protein